MQVISNVLDSRSGMCDALWFCVCKLYIWYIVFCCSHCAVSLSNSMCYLRKYTTQFGRAFASILPRLHEGVKLIRNPQAGRNTFWRLSIYIYSFLVWNWKGSKTYIQYIYTLYRCLNAGLWTMFSSDPSERYRFWWKGWSLAWWTDAGSAWIFRPKLFLSHSTPVPRESACVFCWLSGLNRQTG